MFELQGLGLDVLVGLVGLTLVLTASVGFGPLKAWCASRAHGFWLWLVNVMGEQLWVGFWVGWWWSVYSGNRLFESLVFGGVVAVASLALHELLTYLSTISGLSARRFAEGKQQAAAQRRIPNVRDPRISEDDAHALMDEYDRSDPKERLTSPRDMN